MDPVLSSLRLSVNENFVEEEEEEEEEEVESASSCVFF